VSSTYDSLGRLSSQTLPFISTSTPYTQTYYHDLINRTTLITQPASAANNTVIPLKAFQYSGRTTTVTDANGNNRFLVTDVNGWLRETKDATNYAINLGYDAAGSKTSVTDSLGNTLWSGTYQYGLQAFNVTAHDADLGNWSYGFDALGEMTSWQDAKQHPFSMSYDVLSRPLTRTEPDLFTQWTWGSSAAGHEIGQLHSVCTGTGTNPTQCNGSGYAESETYDGFGRSATRSIQIPGDTSSPYTYTWGYSPTTGLLTSLTYPATSAGNPLQVQYAYVNGFLQSVTDVSDPTHITLWTANSVDAHGNYVQETLGNGVVVNHSFDAVTNVLNSVTAGPSGGTLLQNNSYLFDNAGNLTQRQDNVAGVTENAYYDSLNRLSHTVGDTNTQLTYDTMGRLASWAVYGAAANTVNYVTQQAGCSYYANSQPHAQRSSTQGSPQSYCYDANGNLTSVSYQGALEQSQSWTSFNQPLSMTQGSSSSQFLYDHNHKRWQQLASFSGTSETITYIGSALEKVAISSSTAYRHYIPAGNTFVEYVRSNTAPTTIYYATRDHIGSTALITNSAGSPVVTEKYAAMGWSENSSTDQATIRGMGTVDRQMTPRGRAALLSYTGELIDNIEQHGQSANWYISSYLDPDRIPPTCEVAIFNFGLTFADTFQALAQSSFPRQLVAPYLEAHHRGGWFSPAWNTEDLLTLVALQGGISSKASDSSDTRGQGTVDLITFFQDICAACDPGSLAHARMAMLSGNTHILFDGTYRMAPDSTGRQVLAFNVANSLAEPPDSRYVRHLRDIRFPGTVGSIRFPLQHTAAAS